MSELEILYSPSFWCKRNLTPREVIAHHLDFIEKESSKNRKSASCQLDISYGNTDRQFFDIFGTNLPDDAPILVFIHGGYWHIEQLSKNSYHFLADNFNKRGIKVFFLGYDLCPHVKLAEIVNQVTHGAQKCIEYARINKSKGLYFAGHSAGAHLASTLFQTENSLDGAILISGIYDLIPLLKTETNKALHLDETEALELSPINKKLSKNSNARFLCVVGANESPEFIKQTANFQKKLSNWQYKASYLELKNTDHFDIIERLSDENFALFRIITQFIYKKL